MAQQFQYFAFISYKSEDIEWVKWLQDKLEKYKPPKLLLKKYPHIPSELRIFLDKKDLPGGVLSTELNKGLDNSRYLIVICSPRSAKDCFVNQEIARFRESHPIESIFLLIVDGAPKTGDERECFNREILKICREGKELKGINVQETGKPKAIAFLLAGLFGIDKEWMWDRFKKAENKRRMTKITIATIIVVLFALSYFLFSSFDAQIRVKEAEPHSLPFKGGVITISYDGKTEKMPLISSDSVVVFPKIHSKYLKSQVKVSFESEGYLPLDTLLSFEKNTTLPIQRDSSKAVIMGHVTEIKGIEPVAISGVEITIEYTDIQSFTDENGFFRIVVPLNQQQENYNIVLSKPRYSESHKTIRPDHKTVGSYNLNKK